MRDTSAAWSRRPFSGSTSSGRGLIRDRAAEAEAVQSDNGHEDRAPERHRPQGEWKHDRLSARAREERSVCVRRAIPRQVCAASTGFLHPLLMLRAAWVLLLERTKARLPAGVQASLAMSRRALYSALGALLALGAPLGLLLLQSIRAGRMSRDWLVEELAAHTAIHVYVAVGTLIAFTAFGYFLGREGDALREIARTDALTGLLNRRAFVDRLYGEFARATRYHTPLSLLLVDLDGLKEINDRAGHRAGDAALLGLARSLRDGCRSTDVGARWGGDEFVVLAPETDSGEARELAERIRTFAASSPPGFTVSIGVATVEPGERAAAGSAAAKAGSAVRLAGVATLEAKADAALYEAKRVGKNRVVAL